MSERPYQAADVYNATHDRALYDWVAGLEAEIDRLQGEVERGFVDAMRWQVIASKAEADSTHYREALEAIAYPFRQEDAAAIARQALSNQPSNQGEHDG